MKTTTEMKVDQVKINLFEQPETTGTENTRYCQ